jgi:hypothetical protein
MPEQAKLHRQPTAAPLAGELFPTRLEPRNPTALDAIAAIHQAIAGVHQELTDRLIASQADPIMRGLTKTLLAQLESFRDEIAGGRGPNAHFSAIQLVATRLGTPPEDLLAWLDSTNKPSNN